MTKKTTSKSTKDRALTGLGNLIKLLPTGTVFLFQFLSPLLSNSGHCLPFNKVLMSILLVVCGFNCAFSCFTDSYTDHEGNIHYGVATKTGLWPAGEEARGVDLSRYKLRVGDFVHAFLCVIVFCVVALLDHNTVGCFFPGFVVAQKTLVMLLPPLVGGLASAVFAVFPSTRHGIGYPPANSSGSGDHNRGSG